MKIQFWFAAFTASCSGSYAAERTSLRQSRGLSESDLPSIDMITYSFNALSGEPASQQRLSVSGGKKIWTLTPSGGKSVPYMEISEMSKVPTCETSGETTSTSYIRSSSALSMQSEKKSTGFHHEVDLGVEIPVGSATLSAETTLKNSLLFGNSITSQNAFKQGISQYERSSEAYGTRISYTVKVDYDSITSWTDEFMDACKDLGTNPDVSQMIDFFKEFGTHGISKASFGKECSASLYLGSEQTLTSYNEFMSGSNSDTVNILGFTFGSESTSGTVNQGNETNKIQYRIANQGCMGQIESKASCSGNWMDGDGVDRPTIVNSVYFPIWDMKVPTLSQGAKNNLLIFFQEMTGLSTLCGDIHCSSQGACAPKADFWKTRSNNGDITFDDLAYLDGSKCFCFDDFRDGSDEKCAKGQAISVSTPSLFGNYLNSWDEEIKYMPRNESPICGIYSTHHNYFEDRMFKVKDCNIDGAKVVGEQTTITSKYHEEFELQCDVDKVMTGLYSVHSNDLEDRRWTARCSHFENTIVDERSCEGFSEYANEYDEVMEYTCPKGKVFHKFGGRYHGYYKDRIFKFDCCELMYHKENPHLLKSDWGPYENDFDKPLEVTATSNGSDGAFCGMSSFHDNFFEDRKFRFKVCVPPADANIINSYPIYRNDWDAKVDFSCSKDFVLTSIQSNHWDEKEDRQWRFRCSYFYGMRTDSCYKTQPVNYYDEEINFECGSQHVLAGIESVHDNYHEDRMWSFTCCRWTSIPEEKYLTSLDNLSHFQLAYIRHETDS